MKSVYPRDDHELVKHLTWRGEYIRPIGPDEDIDAVLEKRKVDKQYDKMWSDLEAKRGRGAYWALCNTIRLLLKGRVGASPAALGRRKLCDEFAPLGRRAVAEPAKKITR